jgi:hypothetical protein
VESVISTTVPTGTTAFRAGCWTCTVPGELQLLVVPHVSRPIVGPVRPFGSATGMPVGTEVVAADGHTVRMRVSMPWLHPA